MPKRARELAESAEELGDSIVPTVGYECEHTAHAMKQFLTLLPDLSSRRKKSDKAILASPDFDEAAA